MASSNASHATTSSSSGSGSRCDMSGVYKPGISDLLTLTKQHR